MISYDSLFTQGFEHSVANMFFIPLAIMEGCGMTINEFIARNLIPVTLGNIFGGAMFISIQYLIYHPYISKDEEKMTLKQGGKYLPFQKHSNREDHQIPGHEHTMFRGLYSWYLSHIVEREQRDLTTANTSNITPKRDAIFSDQELSNFKTVGEDGDDRANIA